MSMGWYLAVVAQPPPPQRWLLNFSSELLGYKWTWTKDEAKKVRSDQALAFHFPSRYSYSKRCAISCQIRPMQRDKKVFLVCVESFRIFECLYLDVFPSSKRNYCRVAAGWAKLGDRTNVEKIYLRDVYSHVHGLQYFAKIWLLFVAILDARYWAKKYLAASGMMEMTEWQGILTFFLEQTVNFTRRWSLHRHFTMKFYKYKFTILTLYLNVRKQSLWPSQIDIRAQKIASPPE